MKTFFEFHPSIHPSIRYAATIFLVILLALPGIVLGEGPLPDQGCPMAHCDPQMSDQVHMTPPLGDVQTVWINNTLEGGEQAGSYVGLGCSGNGRSDDDGFVACSYNGYPNSVVAYYYDGTRKWNSNTLLNENAMASAPLIMDIDGDDKTVAADDVRIVIFNGNGTTYRNKELTQGGLPISPVEIAAGAIVLATRGGPVYVYDPDDNEFDHLFIEESGTPGFFDTLNTAAVDGNRIYVVARHVTMNDPGDPTPDEDYRSWLVALEYDRTQPHGQRLSKIWHYEFHGPSGASPLVINHVVYFDGTVSGSPTIFAVDSSGQEFWPPVPAGNSPIEASFARDPRGGFWYHTRGEPWVKRLDENDGENVLQTIDVDALVQRLGEQHAVVMTITDSNSGPVMLTGAISFIPKRSYAIAIDLAEPEGALLWRVPMKDEDDQFHLLPGQFPILEKNGNKRVITTTTDDGAWAFGID